MSTTPPSDARSDTAQARMAAVVATLQADLTRSDTKASLLLALSGGALVALASTVRELDPDAPAAVALSLGAAALLAATFLLLVAVRPDLRGRGWTSWPGLAPDQLRDWLETGYEPGHLGFMAELATRKFRLIRVAVDCLLAGLVLLALGTVLHVAS